MAVFGESRRQQNFNCLISEHVITIKIKCSKEASKSRPLVQPHHTRKRRGAYTKLKIKKKKNKAQRHAGFEQT